MKKKKSPGRKLTPEEIMMKTETRKQLVKIVKRLEKTEKEISLIKTLLSRI